MQLDLGTQAFLWGTLSAVSLPIGALIGLWSKPGRRVTSVLMAFGAGALLFALTIELFSVSIHHAQVHGKEIILATIVGALLGGLLFDTLNRVLNSQGAYLRRWALARKHVAREKRRFAVNAITELGRVELLGCLPPEVIVRLIPNMRRESFTEGEVIFRENELGDTLYFIISGQVEISTAGKQVAILKQNDTFGEMALITSGPRNATATALAPTQVFKILHSDFAALLATSPELREKTQELVDMRIEHLKELAHLGERAEQWRARGLQYLRRVQLPVSDEEVTEAARIQNEKKSTSIAIWLGILIDAVPESLIIGMLAASAQGISFALIAGVFLANLPEAMSSAVGMEKGGMGFNRIFWMWMSLCLFTGLGAYLGTGFPSHPQGALLYVISGMEGLAAGAMLTAIAETMLPEAFEQGGSIVGMSTLLGFLAALVVKVFVS